MENQPRSIADVADQINEFTYAVGLGQPQNISVPALQQISGNTGGYLLVTGAITNNNRFMLEKYFLQILAGISNAEIVLDPDGRVFAGRVERVPFQLTAGDSGVDVMLLAPNTKAIDFRLQTPSGRILEPWRALTEPGMRYVLADGLTYFRLALPVELQPNRFDAEGTWYALLTMGRPRLTRSDTPSGADTSILRGLNAAPVRRRARPQRGVSARRSAILAAENVAVRAGAPGTPEFASTAQSLPYSLVVHAYSNLSMRAYVEQAGFEPGASISVQASVTQSGIPLGQHTYVWADVTRPDGSPFTLVLAADEAGQYASMFVATMLGVYRIRVRASGTAFRGEPFTREKTLTAAVWRGGNSTGAGGSGGATGPTLCDLLRCLLHSDGVISASVEQRLRALGIDLAAVRKCAEQFCRER
jgi:hypothetical protein